MECEAVRRYLDAYWNQELAEEQMRAIDEHLTGCDDCLRFMGGPDLLADLNDPEMERLMLTPPPLPESFTAEVMERVAAEQSSLLNLIGAWLKQHLVQHQYASMAYALAATIVVVSAGNQLFLWSQSTDRLSVWTAQGQAYWAAFQAYVLPVSERLFSMWQSLTALLY